jgi:hypothetical protein
LTECFAYQATVSADGEPDKDYFGLTEGPFKTHYNAHARTFRVEKLRTETALSKYVWFLQDKGQAYTIRWGILRRASPYR